MGVTSAESRMPENDHQNRIGIVICNNKWRLTQKEQCGHKNANESQKPRREQLLRVRKLLVSGTYMISSRSRRNMDKVSLMTYDFDF